MIDNKKGFIGPKQDSSLVFKILRIKLLCLFAVSVLKCKHIIRKFYMVFDIDNEAIITDKVNVTDTLLSRIKFSFKQNIGAFTKAAPGGFHDFMHMLSKFKINRFVSVAFIGITIAIIAAINFFSIAVEVRIDGKVIGYIDDIGNYKIAEAAVTSQKTENLGHPYILKQIPEYKLTFVSKSAVMDEVQLETALSNSIKDIKDLYVISVDGTVIGALNYREPIDQMLVNIKEERTGSVSEANASDFLNDIRIEKMSLESEFQDDVSDIENVLTSKKTQKNYTVQEGDSIELIADKFDVSVSKLAKFNSETNLYRLTAGANLVIAEEQPFLQIQKLETITYEETIYYSTVNEPSASLYVNQTKVKTEEIGRAHV